MPYKIMTALFFLLVLLSTAPKEPSRLSRDRRYNKTPKNAVNSLNPFNLNLPDEVWRFLSFYTTAEWRVLRTKMDS